VVVENPYTPPRSRVEDTQPWLAFSAPIKALRAVAVVANVILLLIPVLALFGSRRPDVTYFVVTACFFIVASSSLIAILSQWLPRVSFVSALASNALLLGFLGLAVVVLGRRGNLAADDFGVFALLVTPMLLNIAAVTLIRRARIRFARLKELS